MPSLQAFEYFAIFTIFVALDKHSMQFSVNFSVFVNFVIFAIFVTLDGSFGLQLFEKIS